MYNYSSPHRRANPHVTLQRKPRPGAMADLTERIGCDGRIRQVRDHQYIAWRFSYPLSSYRFLFWEVGGLDGYLILRTSPYKNQNSVSIVDCEGVNSQVAIWIGHFAHLDIWSAILSNSTKSLLQKQRLLSFAGCRRHIPVRSYGSDQTAAS